jgi:hypothetical protein
MEAKTVDITVTMNQRETFLEKWKTEEEERSRSEHQVVLGWLEVKDWEQENELDHLHGLQHKDSCHWIFNNKKVRSWHQSNNKESTLWLTGKPGAGKTLLLSHDRLMILIKTGKSVLSAAIVHKLKQDQQTRVVYYFCRYGMNQSSANIHVLRSLAAQLLRGNHDCTTHIYYEFIRQDRPPSIPQLRNLFQFLFTVMPSVRIVIDGVDELVQSEQDLLLREILSLSDQRKTACTCKLLISSRDTTQIAIRMAKRPTLHLSQERPELKAAIKSFISDELRDLRPTLDDMIVDNNTIVELEKELIEKADGS